MLSRLFFTGFLFLFFVLEACVVVPVPLRESQGPFSAETLAEIVPGETTRADVLSRIGDPDYEFMRQRWWVKKGIRHAAGIGLFGVAGGPGGSGAGYEDLRESVGVYLLVEFDAGNRVTRRFAVSASEPCSEDRDVCFRNGSLLAAYTPDWDQASNPAECTLYFIPVYAGGEPNRSWEVTDTSATYVGYIGRGRFTGQAIRSILAPGDHAVVVISDGVGPRLELKTAFTCEGGDVVHITVTDTTSVRAKLNVVDADVGRAALNGRLINFVSEISE